MKKYAMITGTTGGIGSEICQQFLDANYHVIALSNSFENFVFNDHERVLCVDFDLTDIASIPNLIDSLPAVDTLVNNAGVMISAPYENYPLSKQELTIKVNLEAPIALITEVSKNMKRKGHGRIVNNASIAGHIGHPDIWYGVTKAGLINATKSFAKLLGSYGITVNAIASGPVMTPMMESIAKERLDQIKASALTGRFAKPQEVAQTITWLGTESPQYINGSTIDINDGAYLR
ncbi:SDR family oxidoreductase [Vibrio lamellibrachiae]|uniref:SDR family NAD(P)-dependent oxidoreductase n=1 Tax=Vibrio lamellibrachiae TaxID=2910253 RepID=UPI003D12B39E